MKIDVLTINQGGTSDLGLNRDDEHRWTGVGKVRAAARRHSRPPSTEVRGFAAAIVAACTYERLLGALFLVVVLAGCLSPIQNDTWWQLRAGADMWSAHRVLLTETYSHTAAGTFWPNHEWLSEIIYYAVYRVGGLWFLSVFATALIAAAWSITWHLTKGAARDKALMIAFTGAGQPDVGPAAPGFLVTVSDGHDRSRSQARLSLASVAALALGKLSWRRSTGTCRACRRARSHAGQGAACMETDRPRVRLLPGLSHRDAA
jgi:hypothetical protein